MASEKAPLFLFLLVSSAVALNSYTYTSPSVGNPNVYSMQLGSLSTSDVITFLFEFPGAAPVADPSFYVQLNGFMGMPISPDPAGFGSGNLVPINYGSSTTLTWTVGSTDTYTAIALTTAASPSFVPFKLTVTNSNGG